MNKRIIKQRDVVVPFCEGEAEILLLGFLKGQYSNKKIKVMKSINLNGFSDLNVFKRKYSQKIRTQGLKLKPAEDYKTVRFLFMFDNDLADSKAIEEFLKKEGHLVQLCDPNTEGMILAIVGEPQAQTVGDKDYRKKCKVAFQDHFGCEAHRLKDRKLKEIFSSEEVFKKMLPVLHGVFKK